MKTKWKHAGKTACLTGMVCTYLLTAYGCTHAPKAAVQQPATTTAEQETTTEPETQAESTTRSGVGFEAYDSMQIEHLDGVEIVSGKVERVGGGMVYTPSTGAGYFTINGTIADDSEIAITIHPVSVLRYKLSIDMDAEKTVKGEIRIYKKGAMLVSCVQEEMALHEGTNDVDVCIDTGEGTPCDGTYSVRFYMDGTLVSGTIYEV